MFQRTSRRTGGATTPASGSVTNAQLANMAAGTVKGRNLVDGTGVPTDLTPAQQGENARFMTVVTDTTSSGNQAAYTWVETTTQIRANTSSDVEIRGIDNANLNTNGKRLIFHREPNSAGKWVFRHNTGGSVTQMQLFLKDETDQILGEGCSIELEWTNNRWRQIAGTSSSATDAFIRYVSFAATGATGTSIDVTIWNAAAPFALRILDATLRVSTAASTTAALRTASGGGGSVVLPQVSDATSTFATSAAGAIDDTASATATVAAGGSLFLRIDRAVAGELILNCIRT